MFLLSGPGKAWIAFDILFIMFRPSITLDSRGEVRIARTYS